MLNYKKVVLSLFLLLILRLTELHAQQAIPASGGNASGSGGSVSYTVGLVVYTTNIGTNGSASQGVQQPYEISVVTGLEEAKGINLILSVYPNPAMNYVTLKIENYKTENLTYQLYDNNGKLFENKKVTGSETQIDLSKLVISTYFLKIHESNKEIKVFKIIKH
jgi:hypothetical protein